MKTKAVVFPEKDRIELREVELPPLEAGQMLTETLYSFVSPGTELRTLAGHYGAETHYPIIPGYSYLCRVLEIGSEVKNYRPGDILSARDGGIVRDATPYWGGQAGHHIHNVEESNLNCIILPENEDLLKYTITEVAAISLRGVLSTKPMRGERALVIGQGMIGVFVAQFLQIYGVSVVVCDISSERLAEASQAGFPAVDLNQPFARNRLRAYGCDGFDIVAECSGTVSGVQLAASMIRKVNYNQNMLLIRDSWPRLLLQATYVEEVAVNPSKSFIGEGVVVLKPADRSVEDRQRVMQLIRDGKLHAARFTKNIVSPGEMPEAYRKLQRREISSVVCKWK